MKNSTKETLKEVIPTGIALVEGLAAGLVVDCLIGGLLKPTKTWQKVMVSLGSIAIGNVIQETITKYRMKQLQGDVEVIDDLIEHVQINKALKRKECKH